MSACSQDIHPHADTEAPRAAAVAIMILGLEWRGASRVRNRVTIAGEAVRPLSPTQGAIELYHDI